MTLVDDFVILYIGIKKTNKKLKGIKEMITTNTLTKTLEKRIIDYLSSESMDTSYGGFVNSRDIANIVGGNFTMQEVDQTLSDLWYADALEYEDIQTYNGFEPMYRLLVKVGAGAE